MIDYIDANIEKLCVHRIGNKTNDEQLELSKAEVNISDPRLKELLVRFFLQSFTVPEYYAFTFSNHDFTLNPLYKFANNIFESARTFHHNTVNIAKHLYEQSIHPQIKLGELFVAWFTDVNIAGEMTEVIGIFKSENKQSFLKADTDSEGFRLHYDDGINIDKIDKGCLIFNMDADSGYKICIIDKSAKAEAQYWQDAFLQIKPRNDNYHNTKQVMGIAKRFITEQLQEEYDMTKPEQIDLLNRSVNYFQNNETFSKQQFEEEIFQDKKLINSFRNFDETFRKSNEIEAADDFGISAQAVKKQAKIFKSVLKLDKNFHIYIHGDRELIEQGRENNGRKFYKIFYEEEH